MKIIKKIVCRITGPRWCWQRDMIVNHEFTLTGTERYTCLQVKSHYGHKSAEWWQSEIQQWCQTQGINPQSLQSTIPFWHVAIKISGKFDRETVAAHEAWARLQFLETMKQKYSLQRQEKIQLENPKKL